MSNVRAMDPNVEQEWVPKIDRDLPRKEQFTIIYRALSRSKAAEIDDAQIRSITKGKRSEYKYLVSQADNKRLDLSIVDWRNLVYPDGHDSEGKFAPYSKENIDLIPPEILKEYVAFLTGRDRIAEEEDDTLGEATTE